MRGEHVKASALATPPLGSSPHARGARVRERGRRADIGIIPACAGSTCARSSGAARAGDHPRMRGEHPRSLQRRRAVVGSSPHARGAPAVESVYRGRFRIIPACAGSTPCRQSSRSSHSGSSPHARGARKVVVDNPPFSRIIPACAGSTLEDQRQSLVYAYDSLTFARMQFDRRITESRKSRSAFLRTASPFGTCSHRSTPSKGDPQGWRHRFRWAEV